MEVRRFNPSAALSLLSNGPNEPVSSSVNHNGNHCSLEIEIEGPNRGIRYLCVAMLHKKFGISYYKPCNFANGKCPANQFQAPKREDYPPLEIQAKWAERKANS